MRIRVERKSNYKAFHADGMTMRIALNPSLPIAELWFPEFYDIKITSACRGNCPYCYQDSKPTSLHTIGLIGMIEGIFEPMTMNQRPFQIAYGGGEPTLHPDFIELLEVTRGLGISPNYTTNGMDLSMDILHAAQTYCDGVAVSAHPHLQSVWSEALRHYSDAGVKTNLHWIITNDYSVDQMLWALRVFKNRIHKMILLPYTEQGRAKPATLDFDYLFRQLKGHPQLGQIGFGAGFYQHILAHPWLEFSLYEPESMSKYIDLQRCTVHPSSFMVEEEEMLLTWLTTRQLYESVV